MSVHSCVAKTFNSFQEKIIEVLHLIQLYRKIKILRCRRITKICVQRRQVFFYGIYNCIRQLSQIKFSIQISRNKISAKCEMFLCLIFLLHIKQQIIHFVRICFVAENCFSCCNSSCSGQRILSNQINIQVR